MGERSNIEWTDSTDNIIVAVDGAGQQHGWWCRKISSGCLHCYAEDVNDSDFFNGNHLKYAGEPPALKLREDLIDKWARQTKPRKHFVASMTDVFGDWVPRSWIFRMLDGMRAAWRQIFQVLTKRADIMLREVLAWLEARGLQRVPDNIWLMVSVEDQPRADERIPLLLQIPGVHGLSIEPLIGPVEINPQWWPHGPIGCGNPNCEEYGALGIDWVIVGGESGAGARPCNVEWIRSIVEQCKAAGVPVFVKQLGAWPCIHTLDLQAKVTPPWPNGQWTKDERENYHRPYLRNRKGGDITEWPEDLRVREFPEVAA